MVILIKLIQPNTRLNHWKFVFMTFFLWHILFQRHCFLEYPKKLIILIYLWERKHIIYMCIEANTKILSRKECELWCCCVLNSISIFIWKCPHHHSCTYYTCFDFVSIYVWVMFWLCRHLSVSYVLTLWAFGCELCFDFVGIWVWVVFWLCRHLSVSCVLTL